MDTASKVAFTLGPWGIEQTPDTNWIGPMRRSGDGKVDSIVCSTDRDGLCADALTRNDANATLIAAAPELREALKDLVVIIDKAGLLNLSNGVQLGATSWYVKANDCREYALRVLAKAEAK